MVKVGVVVDIDACPIQVGAERLVPTGPEDLQQCDEAGQTLELRPIMPSQPAANV
jgi:hypothetical protein